jgi:hypothetical protein
VLGYFGKTMELTGGNFQVEVHDVVANDEHAVGLNTVHAANAPGVGVHDHGCTDTAQPSQLDSSFPGAWHHPGERTALGRSRRTWARWLGC